MPSQVFAKLIKKEKLLEGLYKFSVEAKEIVDAAKKIIKDNINIDNIDEELFSKYMYQDLPSVDFLIRTSGELRVSNFLLWQISYAEFYFPTKFFPDFHEEDFDEALVEYTSRDRRFGMIKNK